LIKEQINESKKVNMTSKERGQFIRKLLSRSGVRIGLIIRMYFGIDRDRCSLEEIGDEYECSTRTIRDYLNKGLNRIRVSLTHTDKVFPHEEMEEERKICKQLKEYVEGINPDLIHKELPYYYSKFLDEFMLCLIDGVENTTSRSSKKYKVNMIFREIGEMSLEERLKTVSKDNGKEYREKRLKEMGDGMYKWDYVKGLIEKI
jgi:intergrase/recombinase